MRDFRWNGSIENVKWEEYEAGYLSYIIHSVAFTPDSHTIAAGDENGNLFCWDVATGALLWRKDGKKHGWAKDYQPRLLSSKQQQAWVDDPAVPNRREGHGRGAVVASSPDGRIIASSGADGFVRAWMARTGALVAEVNMARAGWPIEVEVPEDDEDMIMLDTTFVKAYRGFPYSEAEYKPGFGVDALAFSPDGAWIACSMAGSSSPAVDPVLAIDARSWTPYQVALFPHPRSRKRWWDNEHIPVYCGANHVSFSPDGRWLLTDGEEGARIYAITMEESEQDSPRFHLTGGDIIGY